MPRWKIDLPLCLLFLATAPIGQTGPFLEGELLVKVHDNGPETIYRIDPATGNGAAFLTDTYFGYSSVDWMAFDSHRGGLLAFTSLFSSGAFEPRLYLIRSDGGLTDLFGHVSISLTSLAPVGDGRVYFRRDGLLQLLDAQNVVTPVLDNLGQTIAMNLTHMVYEPLTDSLIGVLAANSTTESCDGPGVFSIHRLPLGPNATQLAGPIVCGSTATLSTYPVGLERLPSGDLLLTFADKNQFNPNLILRIDPVTLIATTWGSSTLSDVNGIAWSPALGKAIVLDDTLNLLRSFAPGETGTGTVLATNVPVGGFQSGVSPGNSMEDIDFDGPLCAGVVNTLGTGLAGSGGRVPLLGVATCPTIGQRLLLTISNGLRGAYSVTVFGTHSGVLPLLGGTLYVPPPQFATRAVILAGNPIRQAAGDGFGQVRLMIPDDTALIGLPFFAQAAVADPGAVRGWAMTQALEIRAQ